MTEVEWLTCGHAPAMLPVALDSPRATPRTCRLCAAAFWRWQAEHLPSASRADLLRRVDALEVLAESGALPGRRRLSRSRTVIFFNESAPATLLETATAPNARWDTDWRAASAFLPVQIRDTFGNPFRAVAFDPAWRTSDAVALARAIYDARNFAAMPILADALQDAGCANDDVLTHCRDANQPHARGCWVLDGVLGLA